MPPELRKRAAPVAEPATAPPKKKGPIAKVAAKVKEIVTPKKADTNGSASASNVAVGEVVNLDGFGGEVETNDGVQTSLKALVDESKAGVVLFTYPKASTPGCTNQVCLFRDSYDPLTSTGFAIYGLSKDSPKSNTSFKTKQSLPYPLLCDVSGTLISAIGLGKSSGGTTRGIFIISKEGKVLAAEPGSPAGTLAVANKIIEGSKEGDGDVAGANGNATGEDLVKAETAAEVADTAEKLDSNEEPATA